MADTPNSKDERDFPAKFYDEINNVIGGNNPNEKLTLLLPGIALSKSDFAYDYKNNEPKGPVIEANESRLANKLYDLAELVGGDNGKTLEHQYKSALDMLTPKVNPILAKAKNQLRDLLMKPFPYKFGPKNIKRAEILDGGVLKAPPQEKVEASQSIEKEEYTFQEVFFRLYNDYVEQLGEWANERQRRKEYYQLLSNKINFKKESQKNKWFENQYLQWYEDNGDAWLTAVDQKMSVLLSVFSDNDMKIIEGILDSGFGAELQEARQTLRNSRKINPDGGYIYPVKFNPTNWFEYLDTSFTPVDLVNSPAAILSQLKLLQKNKNFFTQRILQVVDQLKLSDEALKRDRANLKAAKTEFEQCDVALQEAVQTSFTDFAKFAATTICKIYCPPAKLEEAIEKKLGNKITEKGGTINALKEIKDGEKQKTLAEIDDLKELITPLTEGDSDKNLLKASIEAMDESQQDPEKEQKIDDSFEPTESLLNTLDIPATISKGIETLVEGTNRVNLAQHVYLNSIENFVTNLGKNSAESTNNLSLRNELDTLRLQMQSVESDIQDLENRLRAVNPKNIKKMFSGTVNPPAVPEGFTQFSISHDIKSTQKNSLSTSSSSTSSVDSGFWIFRKKTRTTQSQSSSQNSLQSIDFKIEIGMNIAKVGIEREWFNPGIFALTEEMYSVAETTDDQKKKLYIAEYENKDIPTENSNTKTIRAPKGSGVFPCYPTAMVVARDVTIQLTLASASSYSSQSEFSSQCSSSGTFFVFNSGDGASSHVSSGSSGTTENNRAINLRFTTPQIIGFYQQITPEDKSAPYPASSGNNEKDKECSDNIVKFIQAYEEVINARLHKNDKPNEKEKDENKKE